MGGGGARSRSRIPDGNFAKSTRPAVEIRPHPVCFSHGPHRRRASSRNAIVGAQIDGVDFGNPFIMQRQQWAMDMAMDVESRLPPGAHGAGSYSSHPNDSTGTWAGDAAVISQIDAFRAFRSQ